MQLIRHKSINKINNMVNFITLEISKKMIIVNCVRADYNKQKRTHHQSAASWRSRGIVDICKQTFKLYRITNIFHDLHALKSKFNTFYYTNTSTAHSHL